MSERWLVGFARGVLAVFFRRIEVERIERVPREGPVLVVANHVNGLLDPLLVLGTLPRVPRFLAKNTLWRITVLRPFLAWARVIPVHRPGDPGADPTRNAATFDRAAEVLATGGAVCLFPEGRSHNEPGLTPLKTGAARIAIAAEARRPGLGLAVLPVGLVFDAKHRFRSRVLVEVGEPMPALAGGDAPMAPPDPEDQQAVRSLTGRIDAALDTVTVSYATWEEARLITHAAQIYARPALDVPRRPRLASLAASQRAFAAGHRLLAERHPERLAEVAAAARRYDHLLHAAGLTDAHVAAAYPLPPVARFLRRTLTTLALRLPLAALGTLLNTLPYQAVSLVGRMVRGADQKATWKVMASLLLYPLTWIAEAVVAGVLVGGRAGIALAGAVLLAAPATGLLALRFHDRRSRLASEARAYLLLRTRRRFAEELRAERLALHQRVAELVELHARETGEGGMPEGRERM